MCSPQKHQRLRIATAWPGFSEKALILNSFPILPVSALELVRPLFKSHWRMWFPLVLGTAQADKVCCLRSCQTLTIVRSGLGNIPLEDTVLHHPPLACQAAHLSPAPIPTRHFLEKGFPFFLASQASGVPADRSGKNSGLGKLPNQREHRHPDLNRAISLNTT